MQGCTRALSWASYLSLEIILSRTDRRIPRPGVCRVDALDRRADLGRIDVRSRRQRPLYCRSCAYPGVGNGSDLIAEYPALEYAVLMPWIDGQTWAGLMCDPAASARYTADHARTLALATAQVLWELETHHFAHTDIAGGNIILSPDYRQVQLLDIEGMYIAGIPAPKKYSLGTPGYQHRCLDKRGQWRPEGDRFAAAILLTEMLTWWEPYVRAQTPDEAETLFQPQELQVMKTPRWHIIRDTLWTICPDALPLFDQAWISRNLAECPDMATWAMCLIAAFK